MSDISICTWCDFTSYSKNFDKIEDRCDDLYKKIFGRYNLINRCPKCKSCNCIIGATKKDLRQYKINKIVNDKNN